jgi:hypothetical protein
VKDVCNWVGFVAALFALVVGFMLLWGIWRGRPVAAPFTRVGGATRVETALEASRFWLKPPKYVVMTRAYENKLVMLGAARCAMANDAPLLFISPNRARRRLVQATIAAWGRAVAPPIRVLNSAEVTSCLKNGRRPGVDGLSLLGLPGQLEIRHPRVPARQTLAPVVVFAAALAPGDEPDVAVGMALAAHMANQHHQVSLVVVPRFLEAEPSLEAELREQPELVTGGVVLGQTPTLPEDTSLLLRQLLTSTDRQGMLGQLQTNLGAVGPVVAALLAIVGLGGATRVAPEIEPQISTLMRITGKVGKAAFNTIVPALKAIQKIMINTSFVIARAISYPVRKAHSRMNNAVARAALLAALTEEQEVIVWLSSGWKITGKVGKLERNSAVLRVQGAKLEQHNQSAWHAEVLVPVEDIQLIGVGAPEKRGESEQTQQT